MDQQRILRTYLSHAPQNLLTPTTLKVFPTLLIHAYNPEGLARCIVATINRHLFVLKPYLGLYELDIEDVQNYWSNIAMLDCSGEPSVPPQVSDPNIHVLLSTAYNEVGFAWVTDFFLYPLNKRVPQLIPRKRSGESQPAAIAIPIAVPHYVVVANNDINVEPRPDPIISNNVNVNRSISSAQTGQSTRSRRPRLIRYPFPGGTPPTAATYHSNPHAHRVNERRQEDSDTDAGLDGCKVINDDSCDPAWLPPPSPVETRRRRSNSDLFLEQGLSQWDAIPIPLIQHDENPPYGEALEMRVGRYREKLKHDIFRRDGASCAAAGPRPDTEMQEPLFCTQIIPESFDTDRFGRFRRMASVVFSGQYDHLLEPPSSATTATTSNVQGFGGHASDATVGLDHSDGPPSSSSSSRRQGGGHYPRPENILRSSRNAINLNEQWLRWFDEGRFVLKEWGGQYYVRCLDPALFHDPAFARQGMHPNDPWERGHGLRLDIGATTPTATGATVHHHHPSLNNNPSASASARQQQQQQQQRHGHQGAPAPIPSYHQLPTPVPTPTSPAPLSPFHEHQKLSFGMSPILPSRYMADVPLPPPLQLPFHPQPLHSSSSRGASRAHQVPRHHHRHVSSLSSLASPARRVVPDPSPSTSYTHHHPHHHHHRTHISSSTSTSASVHLHPQLHEGSSPRHPGPFVTGQASRQAYHHSRNASNDSSPSTSSATAPSRHSISSLLNPVIAPKLPPSVVSSTAAAARSKGSNLKDSSRAPLAPPPPSFHPLPLPPTTTTTTTAVRAVRKELWDVDALDPRLVRLHEQIVTMWWDTGLQTELAVQAQWVDREPLRKMNIRDLGEVMFAGVLQHKLTLL